MTPQAIKRAAAAIDAADRSGNRLDRLPERSAPGSPADALAVQDQVVALSGQTVAGWKIARIDETVIWGTIYARDLHDTPARLPASRYPLRGVEAEIAFRFRADLPRGAAAVPADRLAQLLEAVPIFEIVDSRFADYRGTPIMHRLCDRMSNGGLVIGSWNRPPPDDFAAMVVRLDRDDQMLFEGAGGHVRKDTLIPAIEFIAVEHEHRDFRAGQILATGTFTGLVFGLPGESYHADFGARAEVDVSFVADPA